MSLQCLVVGSEAVAVTAVPPIANLLAGTLNVPLSSTVATVVPSYCLNIISFASTCGCNTTSEELLVTFKILVPPSATTTSPPSASITISPIASKC